MTPNTSATGGYLAPDPAGHAPLEDQALDRFLQQLVVGIVGLDGTLVRPRWQPEPPNLPDASVNWCAIGVHDRDEDTYAYVKHFCDNPEGPGHDLLVRHEILNVLASFYGPGAWGNAALLRDGFQIAQNREQLVAAGMGFVSSDNPATAPELVKETWLRRVDLMFHVRRAIAREYPVENLLSADITVDAEVITDTISVRE